MKGQGRGRVSPREVAGLAAAFGLLYILSWVLMLAVVGGLLFLNGTL